MDAAQSGTMVVAVGSTRSAKVESVRAALTAAATVDARFAGARLEAVDLTDIAPTMPMTEQAIVDGARLRARTLLDHPVLAQRDAGLRLAVGLEGGLDPLPGAPNRYVLKTWAAVTDGVRWGFGAGGGILLPEALSRQVLDGRELGDVIDALSGASVRGTRGAWGVLTRDLVGRREAFVVGVLAALAPFYNASAYDSE